MADRRMIHKHIANSKRLRKIGLECALVWTWALPHLDDDGRLDADPNTIRGTVVPRWPWSDEDMAGFLVNMHNHKTIQLYTTNKLLDSDEIQIFAEWYKFKDFQTLRTDRPFINPCPKPQLFFPTPLVGCVWDSEGDCWSNNLRETLGKPSVTERSNEGTKEGITPDAAALQGSVQGRTKETQAAVDATLKKLARKGRRA
ncbi:hypothetical protein N9937_00690 [bacterium]|nr:hypothetical protein [bacterium]